MKITAVTFNMRLDVTGDGKNYFFCRAPFILEKINKEKPDIICAQETTDRMRAWLRSVLTDYEMIGQGREANYRGEANPILYRKDRFSPLSIGQFWLSETPNIPGTRYADQSPCPRICTYATLLVGDERAPVRVYSTHLDHISESARALGMKSVLDAIEIDSKTSSAPVLLLGDFNAEPNERCIQDAKEFAHPSLHDLTANIDHSFHDYGRLPRKCKIDYIFSNLDAAGDCVAWTDEHDGIYLSDHYPLAVSVELP